MLYRKGLITVLALLKRRQHKNVPLWDLGRGSVILLKDYKLQTAKRLDGTGEIMCGRAFLMQSYA